MTEKPDQDSSRLVRFDAGQSAEVSARPLFGLDGEGLAEVMVAAAEPRWRGKQLAEAIYSQRVAEISSISTLSKELREKLTRAGWEVGRPRIAQVFKSVDGTERYLVDCAGPGQDSDRQTVETVWMPEGDDGEAGDGSEDEEVKAAPSTAPAARASLRRQRATICVSSQVGYTVN